MIHAYMFLEGIRDRGDHGPKFQVCWAAGGASNARAQGGGAGSGTNPYNGRACTAPWWRASPGVGLSDACKISDGHGVHWHLSKGRGG